MDGLRVSRTCMIPLDELEWRFTGSGGPGGQHANTSNTRVEVRFDVAGSPSLGPRQRGRLLERLGPVVRATASDRRSQLQNRELALERLRSRIAAALRVDPARVATRPTRSSVEARLDDKRRRAQRKRNRRRPTRSDE
ncbi:MAG: alternative ribosome rescue aminoacyl-tRNA hydrolase ArfB [Acidimicrobiia bacterium]